MEKEKNPTPTEYDVYFAERRSLIEAEKLGSQQFDKAILTLSAGALAISLTFIKTIAPQPLPWTIYFLVTSWIAFAVSVLLTLCSFLTSQSACRKGIEILEKYYEQALNDRPKKERNKMGELTNKLNWFSVICFILGVAFLVVFSVGNIAKASEANVAGERSKESTKVVVPPGKGSDVETPKNGYVPPSSPPIKPPQQTQQGREPQTGDVQSAPLKNARPGPGQQNPSKPVY